MHIFLDATIFNKDPFFQSGELAILKRLAKEQRISLYICDAVYENIAQQFQTKYTELLCETQITARHLNHLFNKDVIAIQMQEQQIATHFKQHFFQNVTNGILHILPLDATVLNELVSLEITPHEPFYRPTTDDMGELIYQKSLLEAVTWYNYTHYIQQHQLANCYFISHNVNQLADLAAQQGFDAFLPHKNIQDQGISLCFKSVNGFLNHFPQLLQLDLSSEADEIFADYLIQFAKTNFNNSVLQNIINQHLLDEIEFTIMEKCATLSPTTLGSQYFLSDVILPKELLSYKNLELQNVYLLNECFLVNCQLQFDVSIDIYSQLALANLVTPISTYTSELLTIHTNISFFLPMQTDFSKWQAQIHPIHSIEHVTVDQQEEIWQFLLNEFFAFYEKINIQDIEFLEIDFVAFQLQNELQLT